MCTVCIQISSTECYKTTQKSENQSIWDYRANKIKAQSTCEAAAKQEWLFLFAWVQPINTEKDNIIMESYLCIPVPASSSCGQKHGESQRWHPTVCCVPETAGCPYMGPAKKRLLHNATSEWMESNSDFLSEFYLNVFSESVEYLFCYCHGLGEILFPWFINDILSRVIPIEITDWLLGLKKKIIGKIIKRQLPLCYSRIKTLHSVHTDLGKINSWFLWVFSVPAVGEDNPLYIWWCWW